MKKGVVLVMLAAAVGLAAGCAAPPDRPHNGRPGTLNYDENSTQPDRYLEGQWGVSDTLHWKQPGPRVGGSPQPGDRSSQPGDRSLPQGGGLPQGPGPVQPDNATRP